ncbi:histidine N-alpha-methyltransferase-like [Glandiceps talaboti]
MDSKSYHIEENNICDNVSDNIVSSLGESVSVLSELGAGSSTKTQYIIEALLKRSERLTFVPIDVAEDMDTKSHHTEENNSINSEIITSILPGLQSTPKYVPHWYMFDTLGSEFFDKIAMESPYYHLYWAESSILKAHAGNIVSSLVESVPVLSELGAGSSTKTQYIIEALLKQSERLTFIPIDVAEEFMEENGKHLSAKYDALEVKPFPGEYLEGIRHIKHVQQSKLILFLGSSFSNIPMNKMKSFLLQVRDAMGENDGFLVGIDLCRDEEKLLQMYSHPGSFGPFTMNILDRLNRDFIANLRHEDFTLHCKYVKRDDSCGFINKPQYIQLGLMSKIDQTVHLVNVDLKFKQGDVLYGHELESLSIKWTWEQFASVAEKGSMFVDKKWTDKNNKFGLAMLKRC